MKSWRPYEMTPELVEQTKRVEAAICNELNLLSREGVPIAVLLSGLGIVIADFLTTHAGPASVAPWFTAQGKMIAEMQGTAH